MGEEWKDIKGYEGQYQVSNFGNVRSLDRYVIHMGNKMFCKGKNIKLTKSNGGYMVFHFSINGKMKALNVHRLVAEAFIDNPDNKPCVNHLDCNRTNNRIDNLEWCTHSENIKYSFKYGMSKCNFKKIKGDKDDK